MPKLNGKGIVVGIIVWIGIMIFTVNQSACLQSSTCDADDLLLTAIIAIGMLAPAWIVASIISSMFDQ